MSGDTRLVSTLPTDETKNAQDDPGARLTPYFIVRDATGTAACLRRDSPTRSIRYVTHQKRLGTSHLAERANKINHLSRREARRQINRR
jgi:hypothetical protein